MSRSWVLPGSYSIEVLIYFAIIVCHPAQEVLEDPIHQKDYPIQDTSFTYVNLVVPVN